MSDHIAAAPAEDKGLGQANFPSYLIGFILSIGLTLAAYFIVVDKWLSGWGLTFGLAVLAIAQLLVQLFFFLHLSRRPSQRWKVVVFGFALVVVIILVFGTLWIMYNLNYHHQRTLTPAETNTYIQSQDGL